MRPSLPSTRRDSSRLSSSSARARAARYNKVKRAMTKHLHAHLLLTELFTDRRRPDAVGAKATRSSPAIARTPSVKVSARLVRLQASTAASDVRRRNGAEMLQSASAKAFGALDHYNAFALSPRRRSSSFRQWSRRRRRRPPQAARRSASSRARAAVRARAWRHRRRRRAGEQLVAQRIECDGASRGRARVAPRDGPTRALENHERMGAAARRRARASACGRRHAACVRRGRRW